jgi:hypothetical protein
MSNQCEINLDKKQNRHLHLLLIATKTHTPHRAPTAALNDGRTHFGRAPAERLLPLVPFGLRPQEAGCEKGDLAVTKMRALPWYFRS